MDFSIGVCKVKFVCETQRERVRGKELPGSFLRQGEPPYRRIFRTPP